MKKRAKRKRVTRPATGSGSAQTARRPKRHTPPADFRPVEAGTVSPAQPVPADIPRPDYALLGKPASPKAQIQIKNEGDIARMRAAGAAGGEVLAEVEKAVAPGITTDELDRICHEACIARGGYPSPLNYQGFPKSLCTSVNEVICHGIPDTRALENGDIVNCDVTIFLDGVHGDTSKTFLIGEVDAASRKLVDVTRQCMWRGIREVEPDAPVREIGRAIEAHAHRNGLGVVRDFVGHGVGDQFHMFPNIPHFYDPNATTEMRPGMTFTIEPMITIGTYEGELWDDGWTAVTRDRSRTAQFEHTVLVTDDGVEVLTLAPDEVPPF